MIYIIKTFYHENNQMFDSRYTLHVIANFAIFLHNMQHKVYAVRKHLFATK